MLRNVCGSPPFGWPAGRPLRTSSGGVGGGAAQRQHDTKQRRRPASGGETIADATYSFAGARDVLNAYGEFASAICDIPATRLLGRAPEGMNASWQSQQQDWAKKIRARQTLELEPCLDRLDPYLLASAPGTVPDGQRFQWATLDTPGEKDRAEIFRTEMEAAEVAQTTGAIPPSNSPAASSPC